MQKSVLQSLCPQRGWVGPAGSPPTPYRGRAGSHVGPVARHMPPPGSSCVAESAAGRRLGRSRHSCLAQAAHAGQGHGPGIWVWLGSFSGQTVRTQSLTMSTRKGPPSKLLATIHGAIHSGTRGRAAQGSGSRVGGATVSWPAPGISGVERAQRNLGS